MNAVREDLFFSVVRRAKINAHASQTAGTLGKLRLATAFDNYSIKAHLGSSRALQRQRLM